MRIVSQDETTLITRDRHIVRIFLGLLLVVLALAILINLQNLLIGSFVLLVGGILIATSHARSATFSKTTGTVLYRDAFFWKTKTTTRPLSNIVRIETRRKWQSQNSYGKVSLSNRPQRILVSQSLVVLNDGTELPLDPSDSSGKIMSLDGIVVKNGPDKEAKTAARIAAFLGVPYEDQTPDESATLDTSKIPGLPHWLGGPKRS